jgi:hypothetical protein
LEYDKQSVEENDRLKAGELLEDEAPNALLLKVKGGEDIDEDVILGPGSELVPELIPERVPVPEPMPVPELVPGPECEPASVLDLFVV